MYFSPNNVLQESSWRRSFASHDYNSESQIRNLLCADNDNNLHACLRVMPILNH